MTLPKSADPTAAARALGESYTALRASHSSGPAYTAVVQWVESLVTMQQASMIGCRPERLHEAQARLSQLIAMHRALTAPGGAETGAIV